MKSNYLKKLISNDRKQHHKMDAGTMTEAVVKTEMEIEITEDLNSVQVKQEPLKTSDFNVNMAGNNDSSLEAPISQAPLFQSQDVQDELLKVKNYKSEENNKTKTLATPKRAHKCDMCDKQYQQSGHLKRHKLTHIGLKPYGCDLCSKTFSDSSTLKKHRVIHTEERPFTCEICQKSFSFNSTLKTHMRIHTGERPYSCEICNRGFSDSSNLKAHLHIHKGKIHNCEVCNRGFSKISYLKMHMLKHNGPRLDCELCHKGFSYYGSLKRHIQRIHVDRQPLSCEVFQEGIPDMDMLKQHMSSYTDETAGALSHTSAP